MEAVVTRPAAVACCCRAVSARAGPSRLLLNRAPSGARQKSSKSRTKKALSIPPHPSFLTAADAARPTTDQIIFNPPSSASSVYYTPFKFLPPSDPRRRANLASELFAASTAIQFNDTASPSPTPPSSTTDPSSSASPYQTATSQASSPVAATSPDDDDEPTTSSSSSSPSSTFPPVLGGGGLAAAQPRHHLTKADIEEMRRLRAADPVAHSVLSLARRFRCSKLFVLMCCQAPAEHAARVRAADEAVKARWGPRRRAAREERARRFEMLFNGEL